MKPNFLLIDTSTFEGSIAAWNGDLDLRNCILGQGKTFAEEMPSLVLQLLESVKLKTTNLSAVIINEGPGSYTGLRAGVSFAKGLSFGLEVPLIAVNSLYALSAKLLSINPECEFFMPMVDAGRMEVYSAIYSKNLLEVEKTAPRIVDENFFTAYQKNQVLYFGSGAKKCEEIFSNYCWKYFDCQPLSADDFLGPALEKYFKKEFCSLSDFEPLYLKEFVPIKKISR